MSDFNKTDFEKNIGKEGMYHFDSDLQFMGAHEICKMVLEDKLKCEMPEMDKYIDGLFYQLRPEATSEVKGNAVTCMSKICQKLNAHQIEKIVKVLISKITSTDKQIEDVRDVFVMCLKNIIAQVPYSLHDKMTVVITESVKGIKQARQHEQQKAEQELIEIVNSMFRKWGNIFNDNSFKELITLLEKNVINKSIDDNLRRKSCYSLGAVAVMLNQQEVSKLVEDLIKEQKNIKNPQNDNVVLRSIAQALNSLSKSVANKMVNQVEPLIQILKKAKNDWWEIQEQGEDFDFIAVMCELYESYLSIIENLLKGCPLETFKVQQKKDLILISIDLMTMDPNNNCAIEDEEDQMSDEDDDSNDFADSDIDQDDQSWRVRRSAMLLLEQIILTDKHLLDDIYHQLINPQVKNERNIVKRLKEKSEQVRSTIIQVLTSFIDQIMVAEFGAGQSDDLEGCFGFTEELKPTRITSKLTQFQLQDVILPILDQVSKIYNDKHSNPSIKQQAFKLIQNLAQSGGKQILESELIWKKVSNMLISILKDSRANADIKISCLISLKTILKNTSERDLKYVQNDILTLFDIVTNSLIKSDQFRINTEAFKLISRVFRLIQVSFKNSISAFTPKIDNLLPGIISFLEQSDVDQEIKHAVIQVTNGVLVYIGDHIKSVQLNTIFKNLHGKVQSENKNRIIILKLFKNIPYNLVSQFDSQTYTLLNEILKTLCKFLSKEDRSERISTLEAIQKFVQILKEKCDQQTSLQIIDQSLHMVKPKDSKDADPSLAIIALQVYSNIIKIFPKKCPQYESILQSCLFLTQQNIFQTSKYDTLYEIFEQLGQLGLLDIEKTITNILNSSTHDVILSSARAVASLILSSPKKSALIDNITKNHALKSHGNDEVSALPKRQICLLALCEIGKRENLTSNKLIFDGITSLIINKNEDIDKIRKYGSIALGGIALSNLDYTLPIIIKFIHEGKNPYLMINTIKEIIQSSAKINDNSLKQIINFLFEQAGHKTGSNEQDLTNIVSECIGKISLFKLDLIKDRLLKGLESSDENIRYTTASSFRYFFTQQGIENSNVYDLHEVLSTLVQIVEDKSVHVREAMIKSLNSVAFNSPYLVEQYVSSSFFSKLRPSFSYFDVVETDLGAFKDKRDKGAPLRTSAFQFLLNSINFKNVPDFHEEIIKVCLDKIKDESESELKLIRIQILLKIAQTSPGKTWPYVIKIKDGIVSVIKTYANDKPIPESALDLVRTSLKVFHTIDTSMEEKNPDFSNFLAKLKEQNKGKFGKIFDTFE